MDDSSIEVFVNDGEGGPAVAICLRGCSVVEVDGELCPVFEVDPERAMLLAEGLVDCAGAIVKGEIR